MRIVYADDTAITFTSENNEKLKYTIDNMITKIEKWYTFNKLKININKTKIVNKNDACLQVLAVIPSIIILLSVRICPADDVFCLNLL